MVCGVIYREGLGFWLLSGHFWFDHKKELKAFSVKYSQKVIFSRRIIIQIFF